MQGLTLHVSWIKPESTMGRLIVPGHQAVVMLSLDGCKSLEEMAYLLRDALAEWHLTGSATETMLVGRHFFGHT